MIEIRILVPDSSQTEQAIGRLAMDVLGIRGARMSLQENQRPMPPPGNHGDAVVVAGSTVVDG